MPRLRRLLALALALGLGPASAACSAGSASGAPVDLTVYAAASLGPALSKAAAVYRNGHPGTSITLSTDSSAALETKIEQGAPADVFLSADLANAIKLVDAGLASGTAVPFASNRLAIVIPLGNPADLMTPVDLARPGVKIVAAGPRVPITGYAEQLIANLAGLPGYPSGFAAAYHGNVVSHEDNVAAVLAKIELGEGDAGIVYATDARASSRVGTLAVPDTANVAARYAGVVVDDSPNGAAATAFLAWLAGPGGQDVLASFGFGPP
jgi:molybdate transport system substrate-binding protein